MLDVKRFVGCVTLLAKRFVGCVTLLAKRFVRLCHVVGKTLCRLCMLRGIRSFNEGTLPLRVARSGTKRPKYGR